MSSCSSSEASDCSERDPDFVSPPGRNYIAKTRRIDDFTSLLKDQHKTGVTNEALAAKHGVRKAEYEKLLSQYSAQYLITKHDSLISVRGFIPLLCDLLRSASQRTVAATSVKQIPFRIGGDAKSDSMSGGPSKLFSLCLHLLNDSTPQSSTWSVPLGFSLGSDSSKILNAFYHAGQLGIPALLRYLASSDAVVIDAGLPALGPGYITGDFPAACSFVETFVADAAQWKPLNAVRLLPTDKRVLRQKRRLRKKAATAKRRAAAAAAADDTDSDSSATESSGSRSEAATSSDADESDIEYSSLDRWQNDVLCPVCLMPASVVYDLSPAAIVRCIPRSDKTIVRLVSECCKTLQNTILNISLNNLACSIMSL